MSIRRAFLVLIAAVTLLAACSHDPSAAAPDAGSDTDVDSDSDSDGDTETDSVPWSTPEDAGVLLSVWGSGPDDVYAGGEARTLLHGSGTTWELLPLPEGSAVSDLHGSAWDSVYLLLDYDEGGEMMIEYDGSGWSTAVSDWDYSPKIWVAGADDVFGVSTYALPMEPGVYGAGALHFDGAEWTTLWVDDYMAEGDADWLFDDMAGTDTGYLFAVGVTWGYELQPSVAVSDGAGWWIEELPAPDLHGVWALDAENVWAVGDGGAILKRGETEWTYEDAPTSARLDGIFGWSATEQVAVGDGVILRKSGAAWELEAPPISGVHLHGVWGATPDDVYAVGELDGGALIIHYDGAAWTVVYGG
jgi:hypothetical protein